VPRGKVPGPKFSEHREKKGTAVKSVDSEGEISIIMK
jgi:hypothetical protein